ncbi:MAG: hypothetical protein EBR82_24725 [Caulobacteraceae bacterium]|nr:hypothetical protein [Caulobacteraceae bacterium]
MPVSIDVPGLGPVSIPDNVPEGQVDSYINALAKKRGVDIAPPPPPAPKSYGIGAAAQDIGVSALGLVPSVVETFAEFTPTDRALAAIGAQRGIAGLMPETEIGKDISKYGVLRGTAKSLRDLQKDLYTEQAQAAQKEFQQKLAEQEGIAGQAGVAFKETLTTPELLTSQLPESLLSMIGGRGIVKGAEKLIKGVAPEFVKEAGEKAVGKAAEKLGAERVAKLKEFTGGPETLRTVAGGAALQGASVANQNFITTMDMPLEKLAATPEYQEAIESGMTPDEARLSVARGAANGALAPATALSIVAQYAVPGGSSFERLFAGATERTLGAQGALQVAKQIGKSTLGEAGSEALEEGGGQFISNIFTPGQEDLTQGVGAAVGAAGALGALMGGGAGGINALQARRAQQVIEERQAEEERARQELDARMPPVEQIQHPEPAQIAPEQVRSTAQGLVTSLQPGATFNLNDIVNTSGLAGGDAAAVANDLLNRGEIIREPGDAFSFRRVNDNERVVPLGNPDQSYVYTVPTTRAGSEINDGYTVESSALGVARDVANQEEADKLKQLMLDRAGEQAAVVDEQINNLIEQERQVTRTIEEAMLRPEITREQLQGLTESGTQASEKIKQEIAKLEEQKAAILAEPVVTPINPRAENGYEVRLHTPGEAARVLSGFATEQEAYDAIIDNASPEQERSIVEDPAYEGVRNRLEERAAQLEEAPLEAPLEVPLEAPEVTPEMQEKVELVSNRMRTVLDQMGLKNIGLNVQQRLQEAVNGKLTAVDGYYLNRVIAASLEGSRDVTSTIGHETIHALRELGMFSDKEWNILTKKAKSEWIKKYDIESRYEGVNLSDEKVIEEAIADAFGNWLQGNLEERGVVAGLFNRIKLFLQKVGDVFRGQGFTNSEDVFKRARTGKLQGERAAKEGEGAQYAKDMVGFVMPSGMAKLKGAEDVRQAGDGRGRGEGSRFAPLEGATSVRGFQGPDPRLVRVAEDYARRNGIQFKRQSEWAKVDPDRAKRIADAYEAMEHAPTDPVVREAYDNLINQTVAQYQALADAGYKFWFIDLNNPENVEYLSSPWNAMRDIRANKEMGVFPTNYGFGSDEEFSPEANPLLKDTGIKWPVGGVDGPLQPVLANDLFRAVHDAFGHGLEGAGFRADGEENAWQAHRKLFTGSAVGAITSETRGQNSWLNFGPHGEKNRNAKVEDTIFADQKTGLMPEWTWNEGIIPDAQYALPRTVNVDGKERPTGIFDSSQLKVLQNEDFDTYSVYGPDDERIGPKFETVEEARDLANSLSKPIHPTVEGVENFWRWFGNSKTVNRFGVPQVWYHGTAREISKFEPKQAKAIFLTQDPEFAEGFASGSERFMIRNATKFVDEKIVEQAIRRGISNAVADGQVGRAAANDWLKHRNEWQTNELLTGALMSHMGDYVSDEIKKELPSGQNIIPIFVRAEKPFDYRNEGHIDDLTAWVESLDKQNPARKFILKTMDEIENGAWDRIESPAVQSFLKERGYDSFFVSEGGKKNLAVYDPNQVKSAVGNTGAFSRDSGEIQYALPLNREERDEIVRRAKGDRELAIKMLGFAKNMTPAERNKLSRANAVKMIDLLGTFPDVDEYAAVAYAGRAKRGWYENSAKALVTVFGNDAPRFAALLAALSPQCSVQTNLLNALNLWKNWTAAGRPLERRKIMEIAGRSVQGNKGEKSVLEAWQNNSVRALTIPDVNKLVLSGPKVNSFFRNLVGVTDEVTNDAWMANFAFIDQELFKGELNKAETEPGKRPGYMTQSVIVRRAADRLTKLTGEKWTPAEIQETVWSWAKALYEGAEKEGISAAQFLTEKKLTDELINSVPDFNSLFFDEVYESILRGAGYGKQLDELVQQRNRNRAELSKEEQDTYGEAKPFGSITQEKLEKSAAARLDRLKQKRKESGVEEQFALPQNILGQPARLPTWNIPTDSKLDDTIYYLQDKMIDLKKVIQEITKIAGNIADRWNPYLQEELYHGRTAQQTERFLRTELRPLLTDLAKHNITITEFEEFLHNRHAKERNDQIASINPSMPDAGSGISTQAAQNYLNALPPARRRLLNSIAQKVDDINRGTRQILVKSGLETPQTIASWEQTYPNYVPLFREDADYVTSSGYGVGQGFNIRGEFSKRATGSTRNVVDIMANIVMQRERAIVRAEKNRVAKALYGLAVQNPNQKFWMPIDPEAIKNPNQIRNEIIAMGISPNDLQNIFQQPTKPTLDPRTGLVTNKLDPFVLNSDNVLAVRIDGRNHYLLFNNNEPRSKRMVTALKNLDADQLGRVMNLMGKISRWVSKINTQYNPIFGVVNLFRDVQGAVLNLSTTPIAKKTKEVMNLNNLTDAMGAIWSVSRAERNNSRMPNTQWAKLWQEFQEEGGQTGYRSQYSSAQERADALQDEIKKISEGKLSRAGRAMFDVLNDYNTSMENAVRLSAYKVALDSGLSKEQAASVAKNLTVNFNRKGKIATQAGALYSFFNASIQGTARLIETMAGPAGKKILLGGFLLGAVQAAMLAAAGFDDDEPPEFIKERNFIIPIGGKKYISIPLPLGYNVIPNFTRHLAEIGISGGKNINDHIVGITGSFIESFNPIGGAGWSLQTLFPTALDPFIALAENKDSFGRPIYRENFSNLDPTPGYLRTKDSATAFSKGLSEFLNAASGGTKYKPGVVDVTPDQIDYLLGQVGGGVFRELQKTEQTVTGAITGEEVAPYKIPLVGRFYGDAESNAAKSQLFYKNIERLNEHENEIKGRLKNREPIAEYIKENPEARLIKMSNSIEYNIRKLKQRRELLKARGGNEQAIKNINDSIVRLMVRLNEQVEKAQD